jgi:hypothetical protein
MNVRFMSSDSTWVDEQLSAQLAQADGGHSRCVTMCLVLHGKEVLRNAGAFAHSVSAALWVVVSPWSAEEALEEQDVGRLVARGASRGPVKISLTPQGTAVDSSSKWKNHRTHSE